MPTDPDRPAAVGRQLVLATRNPHKLREMRRLLALARIEVQALPTEIVLPPEDGHTFEANALPKARAAAAGSGRLAFGDDSGIEAANLAGGPGVLSARYAGPRAADEANLAKLICEVPAGTELRYVCVIALADPRGGEWTFRGECPGRMARARRGGRGFGYDPIFLPDEDPDGRTMAELSDAEKDAISHRGRAVRALIRFIAEPPVGAPRELSGG